MTLSNPAAPGVKKSSTLGIENDNGNGAVKRYKSKKKKMRRESDKKKMDAKKEDAEESSFSKSEDHAKVAEGEMGLGVTANLNAEAKVQNKMGTVVGETDSDTIATDNSTSQRQKRTKSKKKKPVSSDIISTRESAQNTLTAKNVNVKGMAEEQNKMEMATGETGSEPNATDDSSKKQKRKKSKNKNPGSSDNLVTRESTQDLVITKNDSNATTNVYKKGMVEAQNKMETVPCDSGQNATDDASKKKRRKKPKNKNPGSSDILSADERTPDMALAKKDSRETTNVNIKGIAEEQNKMKVTAGKTCSDKNRTGDISKKRKQKVLENKNAGSSDFLSTHEITQEEVTTKKDSVTTTNINMKGMAEEQNKMETAIGNMTSGTNTTDNTTSKKKRKKLKGSVDSLSTHESTLETATGKNDSSAATHVNLKGMAEEQNKPKSKSGSLMFGDNLNPQCLHNLEASKGEMGSGTTAKDNTSSKKRERQKSKNTSPAMGDILGTREYGEDVAIAKIESSTANVLAAVSDHMLVKGAQGEEHKKVAIGKTGSSAAAVTKENDSGKKKNKPKKKKRPTLGEILNPQYLVSSAAEVKAVDIAEAEAKDKALITKIRTEQEEKQKMGIREVIQVARVGKKLLVLDVNGLLADVVFPRPKDVRADVYVRRKAIFKRPFVEDFLCFCFERFDVGIWSSRTKQNLDRMVKALLGDLRKKLLFLWDARQCSKTKVKTIEDRYKCIVFKNLRKIWERDDPNGCWVKGTYNSSNTLLFDDSPYKALLNPKHTGVFPFSYSYKNTNDDFLGPEGELRTYLEGLAACDNVKMYVQQHPLGQGAIDKEHQDWGFYEKVLRGQRPQFCSSVPNALEELELLEKQETIQELEVLQQS